MKVYQIWVEGFQVTGQHQTAQFIGESKGEDFYDACKKFKYPDDGDFLNLDKNKDYPAIWACQLYDNEADARKGFG